MKSRVLLFNLLFLFSINGSPVVAQTTADSLYTKIKQLDNSLFTAFNTRNVELFQSFFDTTLEFYHDKDGLTGYNHTLDFMKTTASQDNQLKRELVEKSLEVYPIPGYGAMEIGEHIFCHLENGRQQCGTFKFVHVWHRENNEWKITRVISYGH